MRPRLNELKHGKPSFKVRAEMLRDEDIAPPKRPGKGRPFQKGQSGNPGGRPKGSKGGGRPSIERRKKAIAESGLMPLEYFLSVMRDPIRHVSIRLDAARCAAPYVHRKMPIAIEGGDPAKPIIFEASALTALDATEKLLLLTLVEKMAQTMQLTSPKALIEGVARQEAESDDAEEEAKDSA